MDAPRGVGDIDADILFLNAFDGSGWRPNCPDFTPAVHATPQPVSAVDRGLAEDGTAA